MKCADRDSQDPRCAKLRSVKLLFVFLGASILSAVDVVASQPPPSRQPDIFLVTIDTLRADHVHCYGYREVETPALDALAGDGIRFTHAFTSSPITNTSHASILTGLLPSSHGVTDFAIPLSPVHRTITELLHAQGYQTAAFIGAVILDSKTLAPGFDRGFDFYDNFPEQTSTKSRWGRVERRGMDVVQRAEQWLDQHPQGPYFLWVHLYDPHDPYEPPPPYSEIYKDHLYDGEIAYADSALAHFISYLKKAGRYDSSVIVVVGDHGEGLGEHHEDTHGIFLYDSTTHVPLIMKLSGKQAAGTVAEAQVRTVDIAPTLLDLAGAPSAPESDGESLQAILGGSHLADRPVIGETDYPLRFGWAPLRSVRSEGVKFIEAPKPELYDLMRDAGELENKYTDSDPRVQKSRTMIAAHALANSTERPQEKEISARALKALGYVSGTSSAKNAVNRSSLPDPKDKIEEQNLLHAALLAADDGRSADARKYLEKVVAMDSTSLPALRQLGELEFNAGHFVDASRYLRAAIALDPTDAALFYEAAQSLDQIHDLTGSRDALEASLKLAPEQLAARLLLGQIYLELKQPKTAEDQFEAALLLQSESVEAQLGLAQAQFEGAEFSGAAQTLQVLAKEQPEGARIFDLLAKVYSALGKQRQAQQAEDRARMLRSHK